MPSEPANIPINKNKSSAGTPNLFATLLAKTLISNNNPATIKMYSKDKKTWYIKNIYNAIKR